MKTFFAAAAAAALFAAPADAAVLTFTISGDYSATFQIDSSPEPDEYIGGTGFVVWNVPVTGTDTGTFDLGFFDGSLGGGMSILDPSTFESLFVADGPQLYTGDVSAPTFLTGTFQLTEYQGTGSYTLTIADAVTAVPEPASWAMMIAGFGLVGGALRGSRTDRVARAA